MTQAEILHLVREGYALATPTQVEVLKACPDLTIVEGSWVPRWALEAEASLKDCGYTPERLREIFADGHSRVLAELSALVKAGKRSHPFVPRNPYARPRIDKPTEEALTLALEQHRQECSLCKSQDPCLEAEVLQEELDTLFPPERRKSKRP